MKDCEIQTGQTTTEGRIIYDNTPCLLGRCNANLFNCAPAVILQRTNRRRVTMTDKQLVQGCYAVASVGVEPTTFELQVMTLSTDPLHPDVDMVRDC